MRWFTRHQRLLPWRSRPTPYRVWVSEIMLQQTQVATVLPYFNRFMRRFPNVRSLAAAPLEEVLKLWAGLGYYSRARNLHRAARMIVGGSAQPGAAVPHERGDFPNTMQALLALPGVGRYTAGAILSIVFNQPAPILDGNVTRVLCRLFAIGGDPRSAPNQRRLWKLAAGLVGAGEVQEGDSPLFRKELKRGTVPQLRKGAAPERKKGTGLCPSRINQGLMELGALVCTPASPDCPRCPLAALCRANLADRQADFPAPGPRARVLAERWATAVIRRRSKALLVRRAESGRWAGLWEFPGLIVSDGAEPAASLRTFLRQRCRLDCPALRRVGQVRHQLSHRDMTVEVFAATRQAGAGGRSDGIAWVDIASLDGRPVSKLTRKIAEMVTGR